MEAMTGLAIVIIIGVIFFLILFTYFIPIGLFITAYFSGVKVKIFKDLVGMRLRKVSPMVIVRSMISATKAGLNLDIPLLEAHYLAGGNVIKVVNALISASKANLELSFEKAAAIDLADAMFLKRLKCQYYPTLLKHPWLPQLPKTVYS